MLALIPDGYKVNDDGMNYIEKKLNELKISYISSSTNFITLIFNTKFQSSFFTQIMLENGIIVRHLDSFGLPECVRVTIGTENENKQYIDVLKKNIESVYEKV